MASHKKRILLAEDDRALSTALTLKLSKQGFDVDFVKNGKEALSHLEKKTYDLVLLDLIMPEVNGFQVLEFIQKQNINTKVIITSNLGQIEDEKKAKDLGAYKYFVKADLSLPELVQHITAEL